MIGTTKQHQYFDGRIQWRIPHKNSDNILGLYPSLQPVIADENLTNQSSDGKTSEEINGENNIAKIHLTDVVRNKNIPLSEVLSSKNKDKGPAPIPKEQVNLAIDHVTKNPGNLLQLNLKQEFLDKAFKKNVAKVKQPKPPEVD